MKMYMFGFLALALCLVAVPDVSAIDWTAKPGWVVRAEEKYKVEDKTKWDVHPSFQTRSVIPCVVKENKYANGVVFYRVWGIEARKSDGSRICYVPRSSGNRNTAVSKSSSPAPVVVDT